MAMLSSASSRVDRLCSLYATQFAETFDPGEFLADDFYAFQVLERAFLIGSRNRELHNLAVLMHAERKALMETGMRRTLDAVKVASQREVAVATQPAAPVHAPTAPFKAAAAHPERRSGKVRLSGREITMLSAMRRIYRKHFGQSFDVEEFAGNDLYAKVVLAEAMSSGQKELITLAGHFLDEHGKPRMHRRKGEVDLDISFPDRECPE
jgi:hypothetical protein